MDNKTKELTALGAAVFMLGMLPTIAMAQLTPTMTVSKDITCEGAADLIAEFPISPRPGYPLAEMQINNPPTQHTVHTLRIDIGAGVMKDFSVDVGYGPGTAWSFEERTDEIAQDQTTDTPGIEMVIVRGSQTANVYFGINMMSGAVESTSNNATSISFCWALGPCGLPTPADAAQVCSLYNSYATTAVDNLLGLRNQHFGDKNGVNLCGCGENIARWCDATLPAGAPGSCNPDPNETLSGVDGITITTFGDNSITGVYGATVGGSALSADCINDPSTPWDECA